MDDEIRLADYIMNSNEQPLVVTTLNKDMTTTEYRISNAMMYDMVCNNEQRIKELENTIGDLRLMISQLQFEYTKLYNQTTGKIKDIINEMSSEYVNNVLAVE